MRNSTHTIPVEDIEARKIADELVSINEEITELECRMRKLNVKFLQYMKDNDIDWIQHNGYIMRNKVARPTFTIDKKRLLERYPYAYDDCRTSKPTKGGNYIEVVPKSW